MIRRKYIKILFLCFISTFCLHGQDNKLQQQGENAVKERPLAPSPGLLDTVPGPLDTFPIPSDSLLIIPEINYGDKVKFSPDAPEDEIIYGAKDKKWFDIDSNLVHLYGEAFVNYGALELKAGYIKFDFKNNIAFAEGIMDSVGNEVQRPSFKEGENEFEYKKLRYNFKTQKGFVYNTYTTEGDLYVQGTETKFVSKESDSTLMYDQIFNKNAIITSCELDHPHFGIRAQKLKVVPEQLAVLGPARLEIADIPTPLILPFGFFPLVQGKSSGLIFPDNYEYSPQWGFGLQNIGYYFAINDYIDIKMTGDIYLRGSWGLGTEIGYTKRYKYRGNFSVNFANRFTESLATTVETATPLQSRSFRINWSHNQDSKAHPYRKIGGSANLEFGGFTQLNNPTFAARSNSTRRSNLNISQQFPGTPFSASASFNASQNIANNSITATLPNLQVRMRQIYPFKRKKVIGKQKWYENITLTYSSEAKNFVTGNDTTFFSAETLGNIQSGVKHQASSNTSFKILKYFNFNPSVTYNETWYFRKNESTLLDTLLIAIDTIDNDVFGEAITRADTTFGVRQDTIVNAWTPYRNLTASASVSTTIFGTKLFSRGRLRGLRHVIKPSMSMNYQPVNRDRYIDLVDTDLRESYNLPEEYEILTSGVFGAPSLNGDGAFNISYRFKNDFEAKFLVRKDSTTRNVKIFNNWSFSGNYNLNAISNNFSRVSFTTGNTSFLNGIITLGFNMALDPYALDEDGSRSEEFYFNTNQRPLRFDQMNMTISTNFTLKKLRDMIAGIGQEEEEIQSEDEREREKEKEKLKKQETFLDLFNDFSIGHTFRYSGLGEYDRDTFFISTNTVSLRGRVQLTDNWNIRIGNFGYDFKNQGFTYPDFGFERQLHCWKMSFNWQPRFGTYTFFIGVSSNTLEFIKTNYNKNTQDAAFR